jgi:hypothetical protein
MRKASHRVRAQPFGGFLWSGDNSLRVDTVCFITEYYAPTRHLKNQNGGSSHFARFNLIAVNMAAL